MCDPSNRIVFFRLLSNTKFKVFDPAIILFSWFQQTCKYFATPTFCWCGFSIDFTLLVDPEARVYWNYLKLYLKSLYDFYALIPPVNAVIPNQGAAAHKSATKYWKNIWLYTYNNWLFICALLLRVPKIVILDMVGCRQTFFSPKGYLEPWKVENHWVNDLELMQYLIELIFLLDESILFILNWYIRFLTILSF